MLVVSSDRQGQGEKEGLQEAPQSHCFCKPTPYPLPLLSSLLINKESVQYNLECDYLIFLCAHLLFVDGSLLCTLVVHYHHIVVCSWCSSMSPGASSTPPCCMFLLLVRVSLVCYFDVHQRFFTTCSCCSSMYCCYALLLLINILLLCTFVIHRNLFEVHFLCVLTPPCYTPPYSSMF